MARQINGVTTGVGPQALIYFGVAGGSLALALSLLMPGTCATIRRQYALAAASPSLRSASSSLLSEPLLLVSFRPGRAADERPDRRTSRIGVPHRRSHPPPSASRLGTRAICPQYERDPGVGPPGRRGLDKRRCERANRRELRRRAVPQGSSRSGDGCSHDACRLAGERRE